MKRLLGLCALLFAGQTMAACDLSLIHGSYMGKTSGTLPPGLDFTSTASALFDGAGHGRADIKGNLAGGLAPASVVDLPDTPVTYTVGPAHDGSGTCVWEITAPFGVGGLVSVQYIGVVNPSGTKIFVTSKMLGASISGVVEKVD